MCRNHSHLIARLAGEDTSGPVPVLMFLLEDSNLQIESPGPWKAKITMNTSGRLYVPSWAVGGSSASVSPQTEAQPMSLFCLPADDRTTMHQILRRSFSSYAMSQIMQGVPEDYLEVDDISPF